MAAAEATTSETTGGHSQVFFAVHPAILLGVDMEIVSNCCVSVRDRHRSATVGRTGRLTRIPGPVSGAVYEPVIRPRNKLIDYANVRKRYLQPARTSQQERHGGRHAKDVHADESHVWCCHVLS